MLGNTSCFPCIGQLLHLSIDPFLSSSSYAAISSFSECGSSSDYDESSIDTIASSSLENCNMELFQTIRKAVSKVNMTYRFLWRPTKTDSEIAQKIRNALEKALTKNRVCSIPCNQCFHILSNMVDQREAISDLLRFWQLDAENEFSSLDCTPDDSDWALIVGLCHLLKPFDVAILALYADPIESNNLPFILPYLRSIKNFLSNTSMWNKPDPTDDPMKFKRILFASYSSLNFFHDILLKLEQCRALLANSFCERFEDLERNTLWSSLLNPKNSSWDYWKDDNVKDKAFNTLEEAALEIVTNNPASEPIPFNESPMVTSVTIDEERNIAPGCFPSEDDYGFLFGEPNYSSFVPTSGTQQNGPSTVLVSQKTEEIRNEIHLYRTVWSGIKYSGEMRNNRTTFDWWRQHQNRFPHIAEVAKIWLCIPGYCTSFPSTGLELCDMDQMFIRENYNSLELSNDKSSSIYMTSDDLPSTDMSAPPANKSNYVVP
jgi:hypothetical protein